MKRLTSPTLAFALIVSLTLPLSAASTGSIEASSTPPDAPSPAIAQASYPGLEFAEIDGRSLLLDLFIPSGPGPHPVIVSIHGGSWTGGTRDQGLAILQLDRGYAVANIDYRLAPEWTFPAQIEDAKAAVRWIRANAARFALDARSIGVIGLSAGGHLAALLGTSAGVMELEGPELGNAGYSSRVQAVVDYFGPTDLLQLGSQALPCMPSDPDSPEAPPALLLGCSPSSCVEKANLANPITYVTADDSPFLLLHGTADCLVPWQQSMLLHESLRAAGVESKLILLPGGEHGDLRFLLPHYQNQVNEFLDRHLRRRANARVRPARITSRATASSADSQLDEPAKTGIDPEP